MVDRDLAEIYGVETKVLNQAVKRNIERFPQLFSFQLDSIEKDKLVTNCDRFEKLKHSTVNPYAFTEQGVAMLSAILRSETAVKVSIQIIRAFVEMKRFISANAALFQRLDKVELKQFESDQKFNQIFNALEEKSLKPKQGVFYSGQIFDAYTFVNDLIRSARKSVILIDNYIDDTVLIMLAKRKKNVAVTIYTKKVNKQLALDLTKHNTQYPTIIIKEFNNSHDRFLIIDDISIYHIGASLKDLGKKWFAFSKMDIAAVEMLNKLKEGN